MLAPTTPRSPALDPVPPAPAAARPRRLLAELAPALRLAAVTLVLTGLAYPLVMTGAAAVLFPRQAGGSLVQDGAGRTVGSALVGQGFSAPGYFHPRPSAAGAGGYDASASAGSNLGPTSRALRDRATAALAALRAENPDAEGAPPVELVTTSGSGLDPHLSPAAARWQVARVARARGVAPERVAAVVAETTEGRDLGLLGEPRVNVLALNLALDARFGAPPAAAPSR
jgi:K+-transporting ATPase ATPase C chain